MWGNLRNTIANAGEGGGLIAKLGDVVAPQSHDEEDDDDYEYEEEGEIDEEEEEYEYYEEEEEVERDDSEEEQLIVQNDDKGFKNGGHSAIAMGKLFGGVLQKGKEKLTETARNLVEPDYDVNDYNNNSHENELINGNDNDHIVKDGDIAQEEEVYDENHFIGQNDMDVVESEDIIDLNDQEQQRVVVDDIPIENEIMDQNNLVIDKEEELSDVALIHPEEPLQSHDNNNGNEPPSRPEFAQKQGQNEDDDNDNDNMANITGMDSMEEFHSFDHDDDLVVDENITKEDEEVHEVQGDATSIHEEIQLDNDDDEIIEPNETVDGFENNTANDNDLVYVEKEEISTQGHFTAAPIDTNDLKEVLTAQHQNTPIPTNSVTPPPTSAVDENNQRLPPYEEDQTMENGNDPAAMEILDETVGHAFNLQETGLDKTIGHYLTGQHGSSLLEESELNETLGEHHVISATLEEQEQLPTSQDDGMDTKVESETIVTQSTSTQPPTPPPPTSPTQPTHTTVVPQVDQEKVRVIEAALTESNLRVEEYRVKTFTLETELSSAKKAIEELQSKLIQSEESHHRTLQQMKANFDDDKELLVSTAQETHAEEVQQAVKKVRDDMEKYILDLQEEMATQMEQSDQQLEQFRGMYEEACERADSIEANSKKEASKHSHQLAEMEKRHSIALERVETKAGRAVAALEDKDAQIKELNVVINDMKNTIKKNVEEHEAVEDEADELHEENEELKAKMEAMEVEHKKLKNELSKLKEEHGKSLGVQIELQLLREERDREKEKLESLKESQNNNESTLIAERDAAKANALDLEQRLTALQADLDLARSDYERSLMASSNLQTAMEAFQIEREAELALLEESRISAEEAIKASNELALQSLKQENEAAMNEVQIASSKAIENMMSEMAQTEHKLEEYRKETINLRRSLDEAIHRLQTNQEDVIDRSLMKNIFIDWHSRSGKARRDVMIVVASVLHFTESDKDKCGIGEGSSTINKVVGAVAPPLTPAKMTVDELDGDNIREKWVNFLLAECGDSPTHEKKPAPKTKSRQNRNTQSLEL